MGTWRWALLEGISVKHAQIIIEKHGYSIRIIEEDGTIKKVLVSTRALRSGLVKRA